jgi:hypothetical protein
MVVVVVTAAAVIVQIVTASVTLAVHILQIQKVIFFSFDYYNP